MLSLLVKSVKDGLCLVQTCQSTSVSERVVHYRRLSWLGVWSHLEWSLFPLLLLFLRLVALVKKTESAFLLGGRAILRGRCSRLLNNRSLLSLISDWDCRGLESMGLVSSLSDGIFNLFIDCCRRLSLMLIAHILLLFCLNPAFRQLGKLCEWWCATISVSSSQLIRIERLFGSLNCRWRRQNWLIWSL